MSKSKPDAIISVNAGSIRLIDQPKPVVLLDFWAEWCGPCKTMGGTLERLMEYPEDVNASDYALRKKICDQVQVCKFNIDGQEHHTKKEKERRRERASDYGVEAIPTLLIFKHGRLVEAISPENRLIPATFKEGKRVDSSLEEGDESAIIRGVLTREPLQVLLQKVIDGAFLSDDEGEDKK